MADVIRIFQSLPSRDCDGCGNAHHEPGALCGVCRSRRPAAVAAVVARSAADVISDLERLDTDRNPLSELMAGALKDALKNARAVYDAVGPRLQEATGEIHYLDGEFWAHPADGAAPMGPFASAELADDALVEHVASNSVAVSDERIEAERRPPR